MNCNRTNFCELSPFLPCSVPKLLWPSGSLLSVSAANWSKWIYCGQRQLLNFWKQWWWRWLWPLLFLAFRAAHIPQREQFLKHHLLTSNSAHKTTSAAPRLPHTEPEVSKRVIPQLKYLLYFNYVLYFWFLLGHLLCHFWHFHFPHCGLFLSLSLCKPFYSRL